MDEVTPRHPIILLGADADIKLEVMIADRTAVAMAGLAIGVRRRLDRGIGVLWFAGVRGVGGAVMPAGEPRVFVDHCREPLGGLVIGAFPQRAEGAGGADDRQIIDAV